MNGIWIRGAAVAITITLVVAALRGRADGGRDASVQPLAQRRVTGWSGDRPAGIAPDTRLGTGDSPMPLILSTPSLPGPGNALSGGVHALRDTSRQGCLGTGSGVQTATDVEC